MLAVLLGIAAAEVDFDKVEVHLAEIEAGIALVMAVHAHTDAQAVVVPEVSAGMASGVGIDAGLESQGVDMVGDGPQTVGEALRVGQQGAVGSAAALKAVVYINIGIAGAVQPFGHHEVGLPADKAVADMHAVGVPRAPPHHGRQVVTALSSGSEGIKQGEGLEDGSF